jgi:Ca2+-binding RTX toxin-like protein
LNGFGGNDTLDGGTGIDTMTGGLGDDTYYVDSLSDVVVEFLNQGIDTVISSADGYTLPVNVENLTLNALSLTTLWGWGNELDNVIVGNDSGNTLVGRDGNDILDGGDGVDFLLEVLETTPTSLTTCSISDQI